MKRRNIIEDVGFNEGYNLVISSTGLTTSLEGEIEVNKSTRYHIAVIRGLLMSAKRFFDKYIDQNTPLEERMKYYNSIFGIRDRRNWGELRNIYINSDEVSYESIEDYVKKGNDRISGELIKKIGRLSSLIDFLEDGEKINPLLIEEGKKFFCEMTDYFVAIDRQSSDRVCTAIPS